MNEGYLKYSCDWIKAEAPPMRIFTEINNLRSMLYAKGLIGAYPDGIGYGNVSARAEGKAFYISGSNRLFGFLIRKALLAG